MCTFSWQILVVTNTLGKVAVDEGFLEDQVLICVFKALLHDLLLHLVKGGHVCLIHQLISVHTF